METSDLVNSPVKWFKALVPKNSELKGNRSPDLMSYYSEKELRQGMLVCAITHSDTHIFALFPNYITFAKFHQGLAENKRCFFEIILGDSPQKPHFDLDFDLQKNASFTLENFSAEVDKMFNLFLETMITQFEMTYKATLVLDKDVLIFTSHGMKKRSFHVIIDNYCHGSNREAKAFYDEVTRLLPEEVKSFVDRSVYSKKQQFRIVGSQKRGSGRIKSLVSPWQYQGKEIVYKFREEPRNPGHRLILLLEASLVSRISNSQILSNLLAEEVKESNFVGEEGVGNDLHPATAKAAFNLLGTKAGVSVHTPGFPYEIKDIFKNFVMLKRIRPSRCQVCCRIHEHENPYLIVNIDGNGLRHVSFDCRRADGKRLYLGILPEEVNGKYLPDAPCLQESQEILSRFQEIAKIPMKTVREVKRKRM